METKKVYALILAGGKSRRMGTDKALIKIEGKTMLDRAVEFWQQSGKTEKILVAVGSREHYADIKKNTINDFEPVFDICESKGPMCGILSAFSSCDADVLYVSAVDMPYLNRNAILDLPEGDIAAYIQEDGRYEPLFAVYRRSIMNEAKRQITEKKGKMSDLIEAVNTNFVTVPKEFDGLFRNLNTQRDIEDYKKEVLHADL